MLSPVGKYVDALYVSVSFDFPDHLKELLSAAKEAARGSGDELVHLMASPAGLPGGDWYIRPGGRGKYQYVLENGCYWLAFSTWANMPGLQLQFKAATLYEYEAHQYAVMVDDVVRHFLGSNALYEVRVSRCDLAVDFQMAGFKLPAMEDVQTRARHRAVHYRGSVANTLTLGRRNGGLQSQIYCKSEELLIGDKAWMFEVWRATGRYDESLPVWRAEVRFFREGLRSFEVRTVDDLMAALGDLVGYAVGTETGAWFRVLSGESRDATNSTRRPASSWWAVLVDFFINGLIGTGRKRRGYDSNPSLDRCIKLAGSMMARAAALHRLGYDSKTALDPRRFAEWVGWQHEKRLIMGGKTWADQVNVKTAELRAVAYA